MVAALKATGRFENEGKNLQFFFLQPLTRSVSGFPDYDPGHIGEKIPLKRLSILRL